MAATAAILLTGGASRRMGTDKATLVVDGVRLVDRLVGELRGAGIGRIVVGGPDPGGLDPSVAVAPDRHADRRGPLAGISAGWQTMSADPEPPDPIVVLSCDLIRVDRWMIQSLIEVAATHPVGAMADDGDRLQPLVAAYRRTTVEMLHRAFDQGRRSVVAELTGSSTATVPFDQELLLDADTPSDLAGRDVRWPSSEPRSPTRRTRGE